MTDFDFMVERRTDKCRKAYVDYEGNVCFEYEQFDDFTSHTEELEYTIEELEAILKLAKRQREDYNFYQKPSGLKKVE